MKSLTKIFLLILLTFLNLASATEYVTDAVLSGDTLESIAQRNLPSVKIKYNNDFQLFALDIKKWNPQIGDWNKLKKNQLVYVDYPYSSFLAGSTYTPLLGFREEEFDKKLSFSVFYASSVGSYVENTGDQSVKSGQNFPVTLGAGINVTNEERKHFVLSSLYWAQPTKGNVSSSNTASNGDVSIPGELGWNLYYQNYFKDQSLGLYTGYDFERLNTFNTDQIQNNAKLSNVNNQLHYATIGMFKGFSLFNLNMNIKASVSKIAASSTNGSKKLTGTKYILYYTYKPEGHFSFNAFYKHHSLVGPTELSINRIGLGVGYSFF